MTRTRLLLAGAACVATLSACIVAEAASPTLPQRDPLELVIESGQARVCQLGQAALVCAAVEAPLPEGTTVHFWHLPNGTSALSYTRTPGVRGVPDPNGEAALRFQAAFHGAANAVRAYLGTTTNGIANNVPDCLPAPLTGNPTRRENCRRDGANPDGGGGDAGRGRPDGEGAVPVVTIQGPPAAIDSFPVFHATGGPVSDDDTPVLPPRRDGQPSLAGMLNPCVVSAIITVCINGKVPGPDEAFPAAAKARQVPPPLRNTSSDGKTKAELDEDCVNANRIEIDACKARFPGWKKGLYHEFSVCQEDVNDRMVGCLRNNDQLTRHHTAP